MSTLVASTVHGYNGVAVKPVDAKKNTNGYDKLLKIPLTICFITFETNSLSRLSADCSLTSFS